MSPQSTDKAEKAGQTDAGLVNPTSDNQNIAGRGDDGARAENSGQDSLHQEVKKLKDSLTALLQHQKDGPRRKGFEFNATATDPARRLHAKLKLLSKTDKGTPDNDRGLEDDFTDFIRAIDPQHPFLTGNAGTAARRRIAKRPVQKTRKHDTNMKSDEQKAWEKLGWEDDPEVDEKEPMDAEMGGV